MGFGDAAIAEVLERMEAAQDEGGLPVHPHNVDAVRLLLALQTQWMTVAISTMQSAQLRRTGLIYPAIDPTARAFGIEVTPDLFLRLQVLEVEALNAWNEDKGR